MQDRRTLLGLAVLLCCALIASPGQSGQQSTYAVESGRTDTSSSARNSVPAPIPAPAVSPQLPQPVSPQPLRPASLFDAVMPVTTTVEVHATEVPLETSSPAR